MADGIILASAGSVITDAIDVSDSDITNAINIGANVIIGAGGATINFDNFDVLSTGTIEVGVGLGLDTNASGVLDLGDDTATTVNIGTTSATALNIGAGGALGRSITIGSGTGIDTIAIGGGGTGADNIDIGDVLADVDITGASDIVAGTGNPLTITAHAASTWSTDSGTLAIRSDSGSGAIDFYSGSTIAMSPASGNDIDLNISNAAGRLHINAADSTNDSSNGAIRFDYQAGADVSATSAGKYTNGVFGMYTAATAAADGTNQEYFTNFIDLTIDNDTDNTDMAVGLGININQSDVTAADGTGAHGIVIRNENVTGASAGKVNVGVLYDTLDTDTVTNSAFFAQSSGGATITNAYHGADSSVTNALNAGGNFVLYTDTRVFGSDSGVITWEDTATNDLMTLTDAGATGNLVVTGSVSPDTLDITPTSNADAIDITGTNLTSASALDVDAINTSLNVLDLELNPASASTAHVIEIDVGGAGVNSGNAIDIAYKTSIHTGNAIAINMGTNVGGSALAISSSTESGDLISVSGSALTSSHLMYMSAPATRVDGAAIHIEDSATSTASRPTVDIDLLGATDQAGLSVDYSEGVNGTGDLILTDLNEALGAGAFVVSGANGLRTDAIIDITTLNTAASDAGSIMQINSSGALGAGANIIDLDIQGAINADSNGIEIGYTSGALTGDAIEITMGTNVAGDAIQIGSAATTGDAIQLTNTTARSSGSLLNMVDSANVAASTASVVLTASAITDVDAMRITTAAQTTGSALYIDAGASDYGSTAAALYVTGSGAYSSDGEAGLVDITTNAIVTDGYIVDIAANFASTPDAILNIGANGLTSGNGLVINNTDTLLTGNLFAANSASTSAASNGLARFNFSGAHTGNGLQIDDATLTGAATQITASGILTGAGSALSVTADSATTAGASAGQGVVRVSADGLTTGTALDVTSTGGNTLTTGRLADFSHISGDITGALNKTADIFNVSSNRTVSTGTVADDYDMVNFIRTSNDTGAGTLSAAGSVLYVENSVGAAAVTDSANLIEMIQDSDSSGDAINIDMNAALAGAALNVIDASGLRTDAIIDITTTSTAATDAASAMQITSTGALGAGANIIDLDIQGAIDADSNGIEIGYTSGALTGDAIEITMGTNVGGSAIDITSSAVTTGAVFTAVANSMTTTDAFTMAADGLTTGSVMKIRSNSSDLSSGNVYVGSEGGSYPTSETRSGSILSLSRTLDLNDSGAGTETLTVSGPVANFQSANTLTSGLDLDDRANVVLVKQGYSGANGETLLVANALATDSVAVHIMEDSGDTQNAAYFTPTGQDPALYIDSDQSGNQDIFVIESDDTTSDNAVLTVEADGDLFLDGSSTGTPADFAEMFFSTDALVPGDVVYLDSNDPTTVLQSTAQYTDPVIGVVSTKPAFLGNYKEEPNYYPIALLGQVPTKISGENGPVVIGDPLTSASIAGHVMKATGAGQIIGRALETYSDAGTGVITAFIQPGWYAGNIIGTDGLATIISDDVVIAPQAEATALDTEVDSLSFVLRGSAYDGATAQDVEMSFATSVTDPTDYHLSIKNTADTEVAYITNEGTMQVAGDMIVGNYLFPSDRGTAQTDKYIYYDGSAGPGGDFMRTNASGWGTGSYDFAEMFPSSQVLEPGDVVVFANINESVRLSSETYDAKAAGIVSTRPGFLAGDNDDGSYPIALAGRVPTKVNLENGNIEIGDPLTTSSTPGYAMKATNPGPVIGYALEPLTTTSIDDLIIVFVNVGYYGGGEVAPNPGVQNTASQFVVSSNLSNLNMDGNIFMNGNQMLNIGRLEGIGNIWSIEEDGMIKTKGLVKHVIESYQGEEVETIAVTSPEAIITLSGSMELQNGAATVRFEDIDPSFNDVISTMQPIRVLVTPNGPVSLYVPDKNTNGFGIKQIGGSDSGVVVDWMVMAYHKDYEPVEEEDEEEVVEEVVEEVLDEVVVEEEVIDEEVSTEEQVIAEVVEVLEEVIDEVLEEEIVKEEPVEILIKETVVEEEIAPESPALIEDQELSDEGGEIITELPSRAE